MGLSDSSPKGVSIRECARQLGISDAAIRKAIKIGRCAKLDDGTVDVDAVRSGMSATANPFRGGQRQAGVFGEVQIGAVLEASDDMAPQTVSKAPASSAPSEKPSAHKPLLDARTLSEQTKAEKNQIGLAMLKGTVAAIEPMTRAVFDAMVSTRSELLALPDRLTPLVTPESDAGKIHMMIESEVMRMCDTLRDKLQLLILQNTPGAP